MKFNVGFTPVSITLNSQAEVDFFYTLLANAPDTLVGDFGLAEEVEYIAGQLGAEASEDCFTEFEVEDFYPALDEPVEAGPAGKNTSMYEHKPKILGEILQREHPCKGGCEPCLGCNAAESNYESEKPKFQPFQINSQEEADLLKALLGACHTSVDLVFGASSWDMFQRIKGASSRNGSNLTIELNN